MARITLRMVEIAAPDTDLPGEETILYWAGAAARIIAGRLGDLDALDQDALTYVITEAVALKAKSPDPVSRVDYAVDDWRESREFTRSTGQITILDEWWDLLTGGKDDGRKPRKAFTVTPDNPETVPTEWLESHPELWFQYGWGPNPTPYRTPIIGGTP